MRRHPIRFAADARTELCFFPGGGGGGGEGGGKGGDSGVLLPKQRRCISLLFPIHLPARWDQSVLSTYLPGWAG